MGFLIVLEVRESKPKAVSYLAKMWFLVQSVLTYGKGQGISLRPLLENTKFTHENPPA